MGSRGVPLPFIAAPCLPPSPALLPFPVSLLAKPRRRFGEAQESAAIAPQTMATATALMPSSPSPAPEGRLPKNPSAAPDSPVSPLEAAQAETASGYEAEREARIRENVARMQKLGILDLVQSLTPPAASRGRGRPRKEPMEPGSIAASMVKPAAPSPARRSLRCGANHRLLLRIRIYFISFLRIAGSWAGGGGSWACKTFSFMLFSPACVFLVIFYRWFPFGTYFVLPYGVCLSCSSILFYY
jgi:hypothetical protein